MSTALGMRHVDGGPSVARQIVRASVGTLTVVAVILGAIALVVNGARPMAMLWWNAFGDRDVYVGDGVVLPEVAPVASVPVITPRGWDLSTDLGTIAAPVGGKGRVVTTGEELSRLAPWFAADAADAEDALWAPTAVLPTGILQLSASEMGAASRVRFVGGPDAPRATTAAERDALVVMLEKAWGVGSSPSTVVTASAWPGDAGIATTYGVRISLAECPICDIQTYDSVTFDTDGRLVGAQFFAAEVSGSRPQELLGAAEVFDGIRHHRGDWYVETGGNPIMGARLQIADVTTPEGIVTWQYEDGNGSIVAMYPADPAFVPVGGGMPWQAQA